MSNVESRILDDTKISIHRFLGSRPSSGEWPEPEGADPVKAAGALPSRRRQQPDQRSDHRQLLHQG